MKNHLEKAAELFVSGCNCSQAVFGAFAEDCGIDYETALKLSSSFGGGMGRLRETCGAVTGMFMVAGLLKGYSDTDEKDAGTDGAKSSSGRRFSTTLHFSHSLRHRLTISSLVPDSKPLFVLGVLVKLLYLFGNLVHQRNGKVFDLRF